MTKRTLPALLLVGAIAVGLTSCGDDDAEQSAPDPSVSLPGVSDGGTTGGSADGYTHPTGADEVVISYVEAGGFTTREFTFQQTPNLLLSGDGLAYSPGAEIEIYPGPLLPAVQVQTIAHAGIQNVLAAADEAGLFADIEYEQPDNIADASTATVTINANGETWVHEAYALGMGSPDGGGESTPERQALLDFVEQLRDLPSIAGEENLGETSLVEPDEYAIEALVVEDLSVYGGDGIEPTVEDWPADVSVRLADAAQCTLVPAEEVSDIFGAANQLTFFAEDGVTYQVLVRPDLPGQTC